MFRQTDEWRELLLGYERRLTIVEDSVRELVEHVKTCAMHQARAASERKRMRAELRLYAVTIFTAIVVEGLHLHLIW
jgi:hypothetical protein